VSGSAIAFLVVTWGLILALNVYCIVRLLLGGKK
jgi:hypothetical protein